MFSFVFLFLLFALLFYFSISFLFFSFLVVPAHESRSESLIVSFFKLIIKYLENWWNPNAINVRFFTLCGYFLCSTNIFRKSNSNSISVEREAKKRFKTFRISNTSFLTAHFGQIGLNYRDVDWLTTDFRHVHIFE